MDTAEIPGLPLAPASVKWRKSTALMHVDNTWGDTARSIFNNWIGMVYQLTNRDRTLPFMDGVDAKDPLGLCSVFKQASGG